MRRFVACSGIHGQEQGLKKLESIVQKRKPDGILFAGGVLPPPQGEPKTKLNHEDGIFLEHFFKAIGNLETFTAIIPGPGDIPIADFLRIGMHAEIDYPGVQLVHANLIAKGSMAFSGVGGQLVEDRAGNGNTCNRTMAEYYLRRLWTSDTSLRVLLLPSPPTGALGGPSGSSITSFFIDSYHPNLWVVGGESKLRGKDRVAKTLIVNPGCLADGFAAWVDWNLPVEEQVELLE